jgi:hypothetical protein
MYADHLQVLEMDQTVPTGYCMEDYPVEDYPMEDYPVLDYPAAMDYGDQEEEEEEMKGKIRVTRGRCYDHNFLRFLTIFGGKIGVFFKNQCYVQNFAYFSFVLSQKHQFFC